MRRRSKCSDNFCLKEAVVDSFRCLGVYLDKNFSFASHISYLKKWIATRCNVLRLLRGGLKISADVLLRVCQTFRCKMLFGSWWLLGCSATSLQELQTCFTKCIRAAVGFSRLVPPAVVSDFTGIDLFTDYLRYWFGSRSAVDYLRDNFDLFAQFKDENLARQPSRYNLRLTTAAKTDESYRKAFSIFPESALRLFQDFEGVRDLGLRLVSVVGLNFKLKLKRTYLKKIIARGTITEPGVNLLNQRYFERLESMREDL